MAKLNEVHRSHQRIHVMEKLNGGALYGADIRLPQMLYAKGVTTGYAYAEVHGIHGEDAMGVPGVRGVYTARDIPGINGFGAFCRDEPILADRYVKFAGDVVAVVVAESPESAAAGAGAVRMDLTPLKPVLTVEDALRAETVVCPAYPDNVCAFRHVVKGDAAKAMERAEVIIEESYETSWVEHAYLEPEAIVMVPTKDGGLEMRGDTQNPFFNRTVICEALELPEEKVRIRPDTQGGSFGGKCEQISAMAVRAGLAALKLKRPVCYVFTREESIHQSHKRHGIRTHIRLGADREGNLAALEARAVMDAGAYVNESPIVTWKSINCGAGPYRFPHVYYENRAVMTNNMVCGAMRGFGTPQAIFALESAMNELAQKLGMSPLELRRRNFLREGDTTANSQVLHGHMVSIASVAQRAAEAVDFEDKFRRYSAQTGRLRRGVGIACSMRGVSFGADSEDIGRAKLTILPDGRIEVRCPLMEIGQGVETVLTQICADGLRMPLQKVVWCQPETDESPDTGAAGASRGTFIGGNAILAAIAALKGRIASGWKTTGDAVRFEDGAVWVQGRRRTWGDVYQKLQEHQCAAVSAAYRVPDGDWNHETCQGDAFISYVYSCHAAEVEVDTETGQVRVLQMAGCHDAGRIINPQMAAGQVTGGMAMGIGMALTEAVETNPETGVIRTSNFNSYLLPTARDTCKMTVLFEENPDVCGPFGGKSLGEPAMEPAPAAVIGAVNMALGDAGALRKLPATLEDVFFAANPAYRGGADMNFSSYRRPASLEELYALLERETGNVLFLAGGTDILVQDRESGKYAGRAVYDLTAIRELKEIRESGTDLYLGSGATHREIAESMLTQRFAGPLARACAEVGAVQLRNRATIGGNIANASPAGDTLGPLAALDAVICGDCMGELRWIPITELIEGPGKLCLSEREFIREIRIPKLREDTQWRFRKVGRRNAMAISRLTLTVILRLTAEGTIADYRAAVGAVFPKPMRFWEIERQFLNQKLTKRACGEMAELLSWQIPKVVGARASLRYKQPVTKLLSQRLLDEMGGLLEQHSDSL